MRGRGRGSSRGYSGRRQSTKVCSYRGKSGHLVDTCYKKHGYPPTSDYKTKSGVVNHMSAEDGADETCNIASQKQVSADNWLAFTPEQHRALLALLQQSVSQFAPAHTTNQITLVPNPTNSFHQGIVLTGTNTLPKSWILDIRATYHVCNSISEFQFITKIKPVLIKLPNGTHITTNMSGTIAFSIDLTNVLYIPTFSFNLISVSKLNT